MDAKTGYCSEIHGYFKIGDLSALWRIVLVTACFTCSPGRRKYGGPKRACSPVFLPCFVCVGGNWKAGLLNTPAVL